MPAAVIGGIIAAGGAVGAAELQRRSANTAVQQEQQGAQRALDLQKGIYDQTRQDLAPYRAMAQPSLQGLAAYAGSPVVKRAPGPVGYQPGFQPGMTLGGMVPSLVGSGATPAAAAQAGLVMMRAPNGMTKAVPREQVEHFKQLGAQVV